MKELIIKVDDPGERAWDGSPKTFEIQELVRCKNCIYWQDNNSGYPHIGCKWREDETPDPDDFCSAGERMEGR